MWVGLRMKRYDGIELHNITIYIIIYIISIHHFCWRMDWGTWESRIFGEHRRKGQRFQGS